MKRLVFRGIILIVSMTLPASVCLSQNRTTQPPEVFIQGVGLDSCGKFLAAVEGLPIGLGPVLTYADGRKYLSEAAVYAAWIQGYISGVNSYERLRQIKIDYAGTELWMKNWCNSHLADNL